MKLVKNLALAVLLACFLAVSAPAGEVPMPGVAATPTPTPQGATYSSDDEPVDSDDVTTETSDYLFFEVLAALLSVY